MAPWEYHKVEVAWASQPDATFPLYTDMTSYVEPNVEIVITRGRTSELDAVSPATATWAFNNPKHWLTPGNPLSPWYPNVKPARKVRISETIGGITYYLFTGYLQLPQIDNWALADPTHPYDQVITMTAVDRLARLAKARSYISTLSEHIRYTAGTALQAHYPLADGSAPAEDVSAYGRPSATPVTELLTGLGGNGNLLTWSAGSGPPADDLRFPVFNPLISGGPPGTAIAQQQLRVDLTSSPITFSTGQVLTLVLWVRPSTTLVDDRTQDMLSLSAASTLYAIRREDVGFGDLGRLGINGGAGAWGTGNSWSSDPRIAEPSRSALLCMAARFRLSTATNAQELWIGSYVSQFTTTGAPPASSTLTRLDIGQWWAGTIAHVQVYVATDGAAGDYTYATHLAQMEMGYQGLARQSSDQRITTLMSYAGVAATDLQLDTASALMPTAQLAAQKPATGAQAAADTERGLLFTSGDGKIVLHSRARRYNPAVAATVDLTWLSQPWLHRVDMPVNTARIGRSDGGTGRARNSASALEYGEQEATDTIETAVPEDATNLARMLIASYPEPRTRTPVMAFELLGKPASQIHTILGREISDRIAMSGLPSNAPEGIGAQHIEGITHRISPKRRRVEWNNSPVLGTVPGVPATWPAVGTALVGSSTTIPF